MVEPNIIVRSSADVMFTAGQNHGQADYIVFARNVMTRCCLLIIAFHNLCFPGKTSLTDSEDAGQSTPARSRLSSEIDEDGDASATSDVNSFATADNRHSSTKVSKRKRTTPPAITRRKSTRGRPPKQSQSLGDLASQGTASTNASATAAKTPIRNTARKASRKQIETAYMSGFLSPPEEVPSTANTNVRTLGLGTSVFRSSVFGNVPLHKSSVAKPTNSANTALPAFSSSIAPKL